MKVDCFILAAATHTQHGVLKVPNYYHFRGSTRGAKSSFISTWIPRHITKSFVGGRRGERIQFEPQASYIFLRKLSTASSNPVHMVTSVSEGVGVVVFCKRFCGGFEHKQVV